MAREMFKEVRFRDESLDRIHQANEIIDDYLEDGLRLTLRQLYYQFVSRDLIPNTERSYKNLGKLISQGRLAGLIDWDAIEDRMRQPETPSEWGSLDELVRAAIGGFRLPRMERQSTYVELWVEKDALAGVLSPIARKYHSTLMVNRGYSSQSAMYESAQRIRAASQGAHDIVILYLGDLDPSGEDMVRDIAERLDLFDSGNLVVQKVALTMTQVGMYKPPPNPTKLTDSRAKEFIKQYGRESWEVDALPPNVLTKLIEAEFKALIDLELMDAVKAEEQRQRDELTDFLDGV